MHQNPKNTVQEAYVTSPWPQRVGRTPVEEKVTSRNADVPVWLNLETPAPKLQESGNRLVRT